MLTTACWPALILLSVGGCDGGPKGSVTGTVVRHDGTPLVGALVIARSNETGQSANGQTDETGRFELGTEEPGDGVPAGQFNVVIMEGRMDMDRKRQNTIPRKYAKPSTSGISFAVEAGKQTVLDVKLDRS